MNPARATNPVNVVKAPPKKASPARRKLGFQEALDRTNRKFSKALTKLAK